MIEHIKIDEVIPAILTKHIPGFTIETTSGEGDITELIQKFSSDEDIIIINLTDYTATDIYSDGDTIIRALFDVWIYTDADHTTLLKRVINGIAQDGGKHGIYVNNILNGCHVYFESAAPQQAGGRLWLNIKVSIDV